MEDTLRVISGRSITAGLVGVLILVLMEDTLREDGVYSQTFGEVSLNPCFNGRYSQR